MEPEQPRWPGDERGGGGVSDASSSSERVRALAHQMDEAGWLAEDPEAHLGPKLLAWLASDAATGWGQPELSISSGTLGIRIEWQRPGRMRDLRGDAYALIGSFAEDQTSVVQAVAESSVTYTVATGQPATATARAHGHIVRVEVIGEGAARAAAGTRTPKRVG